MKLREFLKQFDGLDPEIEIYRTEDGDICGHAHPIVPYQISYVTSISTYESRRFHAWKTKRFKVKILRIS